ncbi:MAG: PDZ domain-containing protein [Gammaproteobacteria bacterium]|nr:PDZ domain-containing protein [Gammaproteobacteria bacterium]
MFRSMGMKASITLTCIVCIFASLNANLVAEDYGTLDSVEEPTILQQQTEDSRLNKLEAQLRQLELRLETLQRRYNELLTDEVSSNRIPPIDTLFSRYRQARDDTTRGFIGVQLDQAMDAGVPIIRVLEGAPANIARVFAGDVITRIGDVEIAELDDPVAATVELINSNPPGSIINITLQRGTEEIQVDVATVRWSSINPEESSTYQIPATLRDIRERISTLFQSDFDRPSDIVYVMDIEEEFGRYFGVEYGVLVLEAEEVEGIQPGDILLKVDDQPIRTVSPQAIEEIRDGEDELKLLIKRNKRERSVTVDKNILRFRTILD